MTRLSALLIVAALLGAGLTVPLLTRAGVDDGQEEKPRPAGKRGPVASREDEKSLTKALQSFAAAFNKGDLDAMVGLWTEDGEYLHESGKVYRGREAIRVLFKKALATKKGHKQTLKAESTRFLRPDVALVDGTVTSTSPEGVPDVGNYSAVAVKQSGKWYFERVRDLPETDDREKPAAYNHLKQLSWMVGEWQDKEGRNDVEMACKWGPEQTYLVIETRVRQDDGKVFHLSQRIGWDAVNQQIRSWVFDSSGGFACGLWVREGNSWETQCDHTYADGKVGTSVDAWKFVDHDTAVWTSKARDLDEQPLPDVEMTLRRKAKGR